MTRGRAGDMQGYVARLSNAKVISKNQWNKKEQRELILESDVKISVYDTLDQKH